MQPLAESAGWLFVWLLRNSAHAAVLALVVWVLERTVLRRLPPRWRYGLWLVVMARLLVPIAPGSAFSLFNLVDFAPASIAAFALQVLGLPTPVPLPLPEVPHPLADTPSWFLDALALWLPGAVVLGVLVWRDHRRLHHALAGTYPVLDPVILDLLEQSKAVMRVRRRVVVVESPHITSPAISGWRHPRLLVPAGLIQRLTQDEARFLFLHELAHVKRADLALNWLLAAVQILHWFNPAVWLALRRLLNVREEVCDELVLRRCFPGAAREYGLTLLRVLEECAPRRLVPALAGILDDIGALRQRMLCIRTFGAPDTHPWLPAGVTVVLAIAGLTEHKNHHALFADATTAEQVQAMAHPARRARIHHNHPRGNPPPRVEPSESPTRGGSPSTTVLQAISAALRQAMAESGTGTVKPSRPGVASSVPAGAAFRTEAARRGATSIALASASTRLSREPVQATSLRLGQRPLPLPPVGQRVAGTGNLARSAVRPNALPPVTPRATLPQSFRGSVAADGKPPAGRVPEVTRDVARQVASPGLTSDRPDR